MFPLIWALSSTIGCWTTDSCSWFCSLIITLILMFDIYFELGIPTPPHDTVHPDQLDQDPQWKSTGDIYTINIFDLINWWLTCLGRVQYYNFWFALKKASSFPLYLLPHILDYRLDCRGHYSSSYIYFVHISFSFLYVHIHNFWCIHSKIPILTTELSSS